MKIVQEKRTKRQLSPDHDIPEEDHLWLQIDEHDSHDYFDDQPSECDVASAISHLLLETGDIENLQPQQKCETFPNAGSSVGATEEHIEDKQRPWDPNDSEKDFQLAFWCIQLGTLRQDIYQFFASGIQPTDSSFFSAYSQLM
jgi:hypothetical protein